MHNSAHTTRNDRFNADMLSFERLIEGKDINKIPWLSDHGKGMADMIRNAETGRYRIPRERHRDLIAGAVWHLRRKYMRRLILVLLLIFKYGRNRQYSIEDIMTAKDIDYHTAENLYFRHRKELLFEFVGKWCL